PRALHVDGRGWIMNNVLRLRLAGDRARQPSGGPNGQALSVRNPQTRRLDGQSARNQSLVERLEAGNARLRRRGGDLLLPIYALAIGACPARLRPAAQNAFVGGPFSPRHAESCCSLGSFFKLDLLEE